MKTRKYNFYVGDCVSVWIVYYVNGLHKMHLNKGPIKRYIIPVQK